MCVGGRWPCLVLPMNVLRYPPRLHARWDGINVAEAVHSSGPPGRSSKTTRAREPSANPTTGVAGGCDLIDTLIYRVGSAIGGAYLVDGTLPQGGLAGDISCISPQVAVVASQVWRLAA